PQPNSQPPLLSLQCPRSTASNFFPCSNNAIKSNSTKRNSPVRKPPKTCRNSLCNPPLAAIHSNSSLPPLHLLPADLAQHTVPRASPHCRPQQSPESPRPCHLRL